MSPAKHTVNQVAADRAPATGARFGSPLTLAERDAIVRKARQERAAVVSGWIGSALTRLIANARAAYRRRIAIAELSALDDRMLSDIGISRSEIRAAVAGASGFLPRALGPSASAPSLNDAALDRAA